MNKNDIPHHLAIIMDGNRRWAKQRDLSTLAGHQEGYNNFKKISDECYKMGIKILTVYAFSTENWKRSETEISYLMNLFYEKLKEETEFFKENKIRLNVIGQTEKLPEKLKDLVYKVMKETKNNKGRILNLAVSYGGRTEIIEAVKKIIRAGISPEKINEENFDNYLYTVGQPDPDLVIRTSGEMRLSNFLIWQAAYSEIHFSPKLWPDFSVNDLKKAIEDFQNRHRRFGK